MRAHKEHTTRCMGGGRVVFLCSIWNDFGRLTASVGRLVVSVRFVGEMRCEGFFWGFSGMYGVCFVTERVAITLLCRCACNGFVACKNARRTLVK